MQLHTRRSRYIAGFLLLFLIYTIYFLLVKDGFLYTLRLSRKWRHIISFICILFVYIGGLWVFSRLFAYWTKAAWNLLHVVFIAALILLGVADWYSGGLPKGSRHFAQTITETLASPVLYVAIGLLEWGFGMAWEKPAKNPENN